MKRNAKAVWEGNLEHGRGQLSTDSGSLKDIPYSFQTRFGDQIGTNPEELIAAAHAGCFSMALANELTASKLNPTKIETQATVVLELVDNKWSIHKINLFLRTSLQGSPSVPFLAAVSRAKANCPISRLLNAQVTVHTELLDHHPESEAEAEVTIYTSTYCQICGQAKNLLETHGIRYREIDLDVEPPEVAETLKKKTGRMSVPQIFAGDYFIASYEGLIQLELDHGLKKLLHSKKSSKSELKAG